MSIFYWSHKKILRRMLFFSVYELGNVVCQHSAEFNRSRNMKQKIYEILTSPKIKTNSVILNNCIGRLGMFMFWQINVTRPLSSACKSYLVCSDAGTGGPVVIGGDNLPSPVGIGLTDLPNIGGASGTPNVFHHPASLVCNYFSW